MTALDMQGLSLSVLRLTDARTARLDAPTSSAAWPSAVAALSSATTVAAPTLPPSSEAAEPAAPTGPAVIDAAAVATVQAALIFAAKALIDREPQLTKWDAAVGDGDCGDTLKAGALAVKAAVASLPLGHPVAAMQAVGRTLALSMGGSSGALRHTTHEPWRRTSVSTHTSDAASDPQVRSTTFSSLRPPPPSTPPRRRPPPPPPPPSGRAQRPSRSMAAPQRATVPCWMHSCPRRRR